MYRTTSGSDCWTATVQKEELRSGGVIAHFLVGIRAVDGSGSEIGAPSSGASEWLRFDSVSMTWSDDYGHEGQPFELCGSDAPGSFDPEMFDELEAEPQAECMTLGTAER